MARKHRFSIVVMLGAAVVAGFFALGRSVQLGAASKPASTAQVSARASKIASSCSRGALCCAIFASMRARRDALLPSR